MLGFNNEKVLRAAWKRYQETTTEPEGFEVRKFHIDCFYPGVKLPQSLQIAEDFGARCVLLAANLGVLGNYNQVFNMVHFNDQDILAFYDPDSHPMEKDWLKAAIDVLDSGGGYVTLSRKNPDVIQPSPLETVNGRKVWKLARPCSWPMGIWSGKFVRQGMPFLPPEKYPHYGFTEDIMMEKFERLGMPGYMLKDFRDWGHEDPEIQKDYDKSYVDWKVESAWNRTQLSYGDFLAAKLKA